MGRKRIGTPNGAPETGEPVPVESKADKFRRLTNRRLAKLERIAQQVANLANTSSYEYTEEQKQTVLRVVSSAGKRVLDAFDRRRVPAGEAVAYV